MKSIQIAASYHITGKHTVVYSNPFNIISGDAVNYSIESNYNLLQFSLKYRSRKKKIESSEGIN